MEQTNEGEKVDSALEAAKQFEKELKELLLKHHMKMTATMEFPQYKILPDEVTLALKIIEKQGGRYRILYTLT